jgi:hypothetical protein
VILFSLFIGDPAIKIAEMADKLEVDIIIMGNKRLEKDRCKCRPCSW